VKSHRPGPIQTRDGMKTLADLKRALTPGTTIVVTEHVHAHLKGERTVTRVLSRGLFISMPVGHPDAARYPEGSSLDWPKASVLSFDGDTVTIALEPGAGPFMVFTIKPALATVEDLGEQCARAARLVAEASGDELVVLPFGTEVPGVQHDDGVTAIAAIDLVRYLVESYERDDEPV
jgi:hypothetical protein